MKLISHRGNLNGPIKNKENNPKYIIESVNEGFDVEIDVWYINNTFFLGHDEPKYEVDEVFLTNNSFWCHAKNLDSLHKMLTNKKIHCFWHEKDLCSLTSQNFIWSYNTNKLTKNMICVLPEENSYETIDLKLSFGICSDFIIKYKKMFDN